MAKNKCLQGAVIVLFFVVSVFVLQGTNTSFATEREVILSDKYQTESEKNAFKSETGPFEGKFMLDLSIGYGFSYATTAYMTGLTELDPAVQTYIDRLGMKFSRNYLTTRLTATYVFDPRLGVYVYAPFGIVEVRGEREGPWQKSKYESGIGDAGGGMYYHLIPETDYIPNVILNFDLNSDIAKYLSLGDGVWDYTGGIQARKFVSKSVYLLGLSDYTYRAEKKGVALGNVTGYGGGVGFVANGSILEITLKQYEIAEGKIDGQTRFDQTDDLVLNITAKSLISRGDLNIYFTGINKTIDFKNNTFGVEFTFPIF
ncbi:MAG: hypothetical protein ABSB91_05660 [Sedimentisphaerales bacterium]